MIFHPSFFDIMLYVTVHLVNKIKLGGLTHLHGMYSIERELFGLKGLVRNRYCPKACMLEGFIDEERVTFSLR